MQHSTFCRTLIALGVAFFTLAAAHQVAAVAPAVIAVDVDPSTVGVQDSVTLTRSTSPMVVDIVVEDADAIGAFDVEVAFDSASLALESWSEGPFLGSTGRTTGCAPIISTQSVRLGCGTFGPAPPPGASGGGVLVTLTFRDVATSTTCLYVTVAKTATVEGDPLATTHQDGCITILADADGDGVPDDVDNCPFVANADQMNTDAGNSALGLPGTDGLGDACDADIDGDGYTNAAEAAVGEDPSRYCAIMRADVDDDGVVSILDIATIAQYFLQDVSADTERYNQDADNAISILDLADASRNFLKSVTDCP